MSSRTYLGTLEGYSGRAELGFSLNPVDAYRAVAPKSVRRAVSSAGSKALRTVTTKDMRTGINAGARITSKGFKVLNQVTNYPVDKLNDAVLQPLMRTIERTLKGKVGSFVKSQIAKHGEKALTEAGKAAIMTAAGVQGTSIGAALGAAFGAGAGAIPGGVFGGTTFSYLTKIALDEATVLARAKIVEVARDLQKSPGKKAPAKGQVIAEAVNRGINAAEKAPQVDLSKAQSALAQAVRVEESTAKSGFSPLMLAPLLFIF